MAVKGVYYYNADAKTLHLRGCCKNSRSKSGQGIIYFDTENEVLAHAGLAYKWCEECLQWREKLISNTILKQEEETK